jgi:predicted ArsR family transcriptional regulator
MARPVGELHRLILRYVEASGAVTARELSHGLQVSVPDACRYLHYLCRIGRLEIAERVSVPHMSRPAMRYRIRIAEQGAPWAVLTAWPRATGRSSTEVDRNERVELSR